VHQNAGTLNNRYVDLIEQTFYFPQEGFAIDEDGNLAFHGVSLRHLISKYGTPFKLFYLPRIGEQVCKARDLFTHAMDSLAYQGQYYYTYCTKSNHFKHILEEVLQHGVHLETSSSFDLDLVDHLYRRKLIGPETYVVCNGFKTASYMDKIGRLLGSGHTHIIPVCDNIGELDYYERNIPGKIRIGLRVATEEEPNFEFYTSRLGIRNSEILPLFFDRIMGNSRFELKMLHFFVDTGIKDTLYYWGELKKVLKLYCTLRKSCPTLTTLNIGGGLPIRNSLGFEFDYAYMIREIVRNIQSACQSEGVPTPDIFTEFGKFTVGESGANIFGTLAQKQQNDAEKWYMIDNSLMTTLPDSWGIGERFILLPVNKWHNEYQRVNIGGLSCDNSDYYNAEVNQAQVFLPNLEPGEEEPLYLGFFHTGAYQEAISGFGGTKHCLIPAPRQILIYRDAQGNLMDQLAYPEQDSAQMLALIGY